MTRVFNMTSPSTGREVANQFIIETDNTTVFQSYDSMIVTIDYATKLLLIGADWDYSRTTGKYRNAFLNEYGFSEIATKKALKKAIENGLCSNDMGKDWNVRLV